MPRAGTPVGVGAGAPRRGPGVAGAGAGAAAGRDGRPAQEYATHGHQDLARPRDRHVPHSVGGRRRQVGCRYALTNLKTTQIFILG